LTAPHTPIVPAAAFRRQTGLGPYGDFVAQTDAAVGQILQALDRTGLAGSTLVIATSDNGCSPAANLPLLAKLGHHPSGPFRGFKADIFEGGHRIPFVVRWPGRVKAGATCADTVCLTDLFATAADILNHPLPDDAAVDSVSILADLDGTARGAVREAIVHQSYYGALAIRQGPWKLAFCSGSGGWSRPLPGSREAKALPSIQLYNLAEDPSEQRNVERDHPDLIERMTNLMKRYIADGRSVPRRFGAKPTEKR
jgi:arylsulfatase A-like enzyme